MAKNYKKIYAVSDVHGYYMELISALHDAGYDENDPDSLLVFCGDLFDRGIENRKVFNFFRHRQDCVLIRGNHDDRMAELLKTRQLAMHDYHNGTDATVREFFGEDCIHADGSFDIPEGDGFAEEYAAFYDRMQDYFEYGDYIFTHGWLPVKFSGPVPQIDLHWREATKDRWDSARWLEWQQMYPLRYATGIPGKTVVCGHRSASLASMVDADRFSDDYSIYRGDGVIAIDACTVRSGKVNVLVLDTF